MFTNEEILHFKNFCQKVIDKPRAINAQPHVRDNGSLWCDDWRIIEILKYYFNGPEMYQGDPPPNRLKNNNLWSKEKIVEEAEGLIRAHGSAENIINELIKQRENGYGHSASGA